MQETAADGVDVTAGWRSTPGSPENRAWSDAKFIRFMVLVMVTFMCGVVIHVAGPKLTWTKWLSFATGAALLICALSSAVFGPSILVAPTLTAGCDVLVLTMFWVGIDMHRVKVDSGGNPVYLTARQTAFLLASAASLVFTSVAAMLDNFSKEYIPAPFQFASLVSTVICFAKMEDVIPMDERDTDADRRKRAWYWDKDGQRIKRD